jgi:hypothetical protein
MVLMTRTYRFTCAGSVRLLAGVALAAVVAGCGSSVSGTGASTAGAGTPATTTSPTQGAGGLASGADAAKPAGVASGLIHQANTPQLTQSGSGSGVGSGSAPSVSAGATVGVGAGEAVGVKQPGHKDTAAKGSDSDASGPDGDDDSPADRAARPAGRTTTSATTGNKAPSAVTTTTKSPGVRVVVERKTVVRDVIVHVPTRPSGPLAAFLSSSNPVLQSAQFVVLGGNVGCSLHAGGLRCTVKRRDWTGPAQPRSCRSGWGNTIELPDKGAAKFICGRASAIAVGAKLIPNGWDDRVGRFTCQVRSIGVYCFSTSGHGLTMSRAGFATY